MAIDTRTSTSNLYDETTFYPAFISDLSNCKKEIIIESPFITVPKMQILKQLFEDLVGRGVTIFIITRHPEEHDTVMAEHAEAGIQYFERLGVQVLLWRFHHRKLAMIDKTIVWKGSLNILSHRNSHEFMEREENKGKAESLFKFLKYDRVSF